MLGMRLFLAVVAFLLATFLYGYAALWTLVPLVEGRLPAFDWSTGKIGIALVIATGLVVIGTSALPASEERD
jgi:hypothetical protein